MAEMPFDDSNLMAELEQAIADLNEFSAAFSMPDGDVTETDRRGVVSATVSPNLTVVKLTVQPTWEHTVPAAELALSIDEAIGRATTRAMGLDPDGGEVDLEEARDEAPAPITAEVRAEARRTVAQTERRMLDQADEMGRDPRAAEDRIDRLLAQLDSAVASAEAKTEELGDEPSRYYSANRMVSMASIGLSFTGAQINQNWLRGKSGTAVTQCLSEILEQAPQDQAADLARALRTAFGES